MSTFARVSLLEESLHSFLEQDYPGKKELVILNDYPNQTLKFDHPEVRVINLPERLKSLGESRNRCVAECKGEIIVAQDDDDIYLKGWLRFIAQGMQNVDWFRFRPMFYAQGWQIKRLSTQAHSCVAWRKSAWEKVGGFRPMSSGEDTEWLKDLHSHKIEGRTANISIDDIQFVYHWGNGVPHASGRGRDNENFSGHKRFGLWAEEQARNGLIPQGEVQLRPGYKTDWEGQASAFKGHLKNPQPRLSVIIATLNDDDELNKTIASIRATAGHAPEIVVIDDASDKPAVVLDPTVQLRRNPARIGTHRSRHIAAVLAKGEYLLSIDSHMRFEPGWYEEALKRLDANPDVVYCACCVGLGEGHMAMVQQPYHTTLDKLPIGQLVRWNKQKMVKLSETQLQEHRADVICDVAPNEKVDVSADATYSGATLNFYGPRNPSKPETVQVFEGVWKAVPNDNDEVPCLMGACYFMKRENFLNVGGLRQLWMWGSLEPYLSLKFWLAGYEIRLMKTVRIGHKFRSGKEVTYKTDAWYMVYNKIRIAMTVMNDEEATFIISKVKEMYPKQFPLAMARIRLDLADILECARQYKKLFKIDIKSYCQKFGIPYFLDQKVKVESVAQNTMVKV